MRDARHRFSNELRYREADHELQTQFTPPYVLDPVRADLGGVIGLDPCTTEDNPTQALIHYTADDDGLRLGWWQSEEIQKTTAFPWNPTIFCNPPYGKAREPWVERCIEAGKRGQKVILLIPAATDTRIFARAATSAWRLVFIVGRVKFGTLRPNRRQHAASHPSALIGWNTMLDHSASLGWRADPACLEWRAANRREAGNAA